MKIVLVNYRYFQSSGAETFMFKFQKLLEAHGDTVVPFSTVNSKNVPTPYAADFAEGRGADDEVLFSRIKKTPKNIWRMLRGAFYNVDAEKKLRKVLKREKPDCMLVLQQMNALSPSVFTAARKEGVLALHRLSDFNMLCPRYDFLRGDDVCTDCINGCYASAIKHRCVKGSLAATVIRSMSMRFHNMFHLFDSVALFITPCRHTAMLMEKSGISPERVYTLPTFIDAKGITPRYDNDGYFLFLGRVSEEKGMDYVIDALSDEICIDARVKLTGDVKSEFCQRLVKHAREAGVDDRIAFTGFLLGDELKELISGAIAILMPTIWYENMPNAILEAFAYGKPVIASDLGSLPDMVEDGVNGILCPPKDPSALAKAMRAMLDDARMVSQMGQNARKQCEEKYAPEAYYEGFGQALNKARQNALNAEKR